MANFLRPLLDPGDPTKGPSVQPGQLMIPCVLQVLLPSILFPPGGAATTLCQCRPSTPT